MAYTLLVGYLLYAVLVLALTRVLRLPVREKQGWLLQGIDTAWASFGLADPGTYSVVLTGVVKGLAGALDTAFSVTTAVTISAEGCLVPEN